MEGQGIVYPPSFTSVKSRVNLVRRIPQRNLSLGLNCRTGIQSQTSGPPDSKNPTSSSLAFRPNYSYHLSVRIVEPPGESVPTGEPRRPACQMHAA